MSILQDLHRQRETITHARDTLHGVDDNILKSRKILSVMARRIMQNKAIMFGIIAMLVGSIGLVVYFKFINKAAGENEWWFGISPEGIGTFGMVINFVLAIGISLATKPPPPEVQHLVDRVRFPRKAFAEEENE